MNDLFQTSKSPSLMIEVDPGINLAWTPNTSIDGFDLTLDGAKLSFSEKFFSSKIAERTIAYLQENEWKDWRSVNWREVSPEKLNEIEFRNIKWTQDYIKIFGKEIPLPRLTAWYGDQGASYQYSGIRSDPHPWNAGLSYLRDTIQSRCDATFNSVLLNWYRDGSDSLSWHADDETELGTNPTIASVSFGAPREFHFKPKGDTKTRLKFRLTSGSLVLMAGETQKKWVHSVPKRKGVKSSRFNMTFRHISHE